MSPQAHKDLGFRGCGKVGADREDVPQWLKDTISKLSPEEPGLSLSKGTAENSDLSKLEFSVAGA
jgi:hypothetical protein